MHKKTLKYRKILKIMYKILILLFFINTDIVFLFINKCVIWDIKKIIKRSGNFQALKGWREGNLNFCRTRRIGMHFF
jgi:hypothetical protein